MRRLLVSLTIALVATPVWAQQVKITFHEGQVSVDAAGASPRAILAEWSKVGGTTIVNAERVAGAPLTLQLVNVPEAQALEIILRSVAGYMAASRGLGPGASRYDRIMVMPTSTPAAPVAAPATPRPVPTIGGNNNGPFGNNPPFGPMAGTQRIVSPRPAPTSDEAPPLEEPIETPVAEPVFTFPQTSQPGNYRSVPVTTSQSPAVEVPVGAPGFGVVGAPMPGMVQVPPPQPPAPARPIRPPGQ